jgi:hypothetical protein
MDGGGGQTFASPRTRHFVGKQDADDGWREQVKLGLSNYSPCDALARSRNGPTRENKVGRQSRVEFYAPDPPPSRSNGSKYDMARKIQSR